MNKAEFIEAVSKEMGASKILAQKAVEATINTIKKELINDGEVKFVGFGTFELRHIKARRSFSPAKKDFVDVPAYVRPAFNVSPVFKAECQLSKNIDK